MRGLKYFAPLLTIAALAVLVACDSGPQPGAVQDEAMRAGREPGSFPPAGPEDGKDYFAAMDNGIALTPDEVRGRDMWLLWTGGNDRLWDQLTRQSFGTFDLLKTISSRPGLRASRDNRWSWLGLVNEPCFEQATGPDPEHFGLWLDRRRADCPADPFADAEKYPGVRIGARGTTVPVGSYYGEPTGIVGLRLFPNPDFDEAARRAWDAKRYYDDPDYYLRKDLVRPYRVGMACAFCHVGPSPIHPPADPAHPAWADLNSTVGAQYFWFDRVFVWGADESNFIFQPAACRPARRARHLARVHRQHHQPAHDERDLPARAAAATGAAVRPRDAGGRRAGQQAVQRFRARGAAARLLQQAVFLHAASAEGRLGLVGALGALNRVFINIGLFSEEWLLHFNAFAGGQRITPIEIATAERNSVYWRATEQQSFLLAQFLLKAGRPDRLAEAPGGTAYLTDPPATLERGRDIFAERCARCHSSKLPAPVVGMEGPGAEACNGPGYLGCWSRYWAWTKTDEFKEKMREKVRAPDFLTDNYLSTEFRVPVTLLQTNACSPLGRNALAGNIWDNFSSQSYKDLPSVGEITVQDPFTGAEHRFTMPAGGRGYTRPPSLVSLWSTAPYLLNNSVGRFDPSPSVAARVAAFQNGIEQMLWPEKREFDSRLGDKGVGLIDRTTERSWLKVPAGYLPAAVVALRRPLGWLLPGAFSETGDLELGPIPAGTPIGLFGNFDPLPEQPGFWPGLARAWTLLGIAGQLRHDLAALPPDASDEDARRIFAPLAQQLDALSTCPDYVVNRGHYFGTDRFPEEPVAGRGRQACADRLPQDALSRCRRQSCATMSWWAPAPAAGRWRRGSPRRGITWCCWRPAAIRGRCRAAIRWNRRARGCPTITTCRRFIPSPRKTRRCAWEFFVRHYEDAAQRRRDPAWRAEWDGAAVDGVLYPRAAGLGGCTAHNALIFVAPPDADWEALAAETGDASWGAANMARLFARLEDCRHRWLWRALHGIGIDPTGHGWAGWLAVEKALPRQALKDGELMTVLARSALAALEAPGDWVTRLRILLRAFGDPNDRRVLRGAAEGLFYTPLATRWHRRNGARERLLAAAARFPARLDIRTQALATRVLFDADKRATGVEYLHGERLYRAHRPAGGGGAPCRVLARREVILCGGAFNSPQLLMLSGIGPAAALRAQGIAPLVDLPGVGGNLQDRYEVGVVNRMAFEEWPALRGARFRRGDRAWRAWARWRRGMYTSNGAALSVVLRSDPGKPLPDLFCMALLGPFQGYFPGYSRDVAERRNMLTWSVLKAHTLNRAGTVSLRSADPQDVPVVAFRYFEEGSDPAGEDLRAVVAGIRFVRHMTAPLRRSGLIEAEELPGPAVQTDAELAQFVRDHAWGHHACGTCRIGAPAAGGVLDTDFRVHGVAGLRVVDASVFPRIPGFFIASAVYMVAEKAANVIIAG